jgi:hypothetical protein
MNQSNITNDRASEQPAEQLLRQAEKQGVRPLSFDELLGDAKAGDPEKEDLDDFAALRREWREAERARSRQ